MLWRRNVGAAPERIVGDATLGVVAGGRLNAIDGGSGALSWRAQESCDVVTTTLAPPSESERPRWIIGDAAGSLRAMTAAGTPLGEPLRIGERLLAVTQLASDAWLATTRSGRVLRVAWESGPPGRLAMAWETRLSEPPLQVEAADAFLLARSAQSVVALDLTTQREAWRLAAAPTDRMQMASDRQSALLLGEKEVRAVSIASGETLISRAAIASPLVADWRDGWLVWLDRLGHAYRSSVSDVPVMPALDMAFPLAQAELTASGFIITSEIGEVGFVEVAPEGRPSSSSANSPAGGIRP